MSCPQPTLADLPALVNRTDGSGVRAALRTEGDPRPLAPGLELSAYRIVQEALTNALKHAPGADVDVLVRHRRDALELERERVALFRGSLAAAPDGDGGFRVRAAPGRARAW